MIHRFFKSLSRILGKDQGKVIAVFAASAVEADHAVRYLRAGAPDVPVWLFALEPPEEETAALCERVFADRSATRLFFAAQRLLWPHMVALVAVHWSGRHGAWAIKAAPFLIPPFRGLIFNTNNDSFSTRSSKEVFKHVRRAMIETFLRAIGKTEGKVIAVFEASAEDAHRAVRYLRNGAPDVPVWLFSLEPPGQETAVLCDRVTVRKGPVRLFCAAQRILWPRRVALAATRWDGQPGRWAIKTAPFFIPFFRALVFNEHNDSFGAKPGTIFGHVRYRLFSGETPPPWIFRFGLGLLLACVRWLARSSNPASDAPLRRKLRSLEALNAKWNGKQDRLTPYDVLVFPVIDWDWRFQRPQHLSLEFARRGHRVFYLSTTFLPAFGLPEPHTRTVAKDVHVVDLPASEDPPDIYRDIPNEVQLAAMEYGLQCLKKKFNIGATLSLVDYPFWAPLALRLNNNVVLYDCMDDYLSFRNAGRPARELEPVIASQADLVVCSSTHLQERMRRLGRESILVRNAADPEHFGTPPAALALEPNGRPIVGYYGKINESTDVDLLSYAARSLPETRFVIIGRNDRGDLSGLDRWPNVTMLGEVPYPRLPEYVHGFDVGIVPYCIDDHSLATDPVKVWEYLCAGKPVVAVRYPEIDRLAGLIALADGPEQFVEAIRWTLANDSPREAERRRIFAGENTWSERCDAFQEAVAPFFPKVSIIVLTYNQRDFTERTLSTIDEFTGYPNYEVILVDNASTDGTPEMLAAWAATHPYAKTIFNSSNLGFSAGNNVGARAATGDYFVLLNNDVCLTDGWLGTLLAHFRADPELGILGPVTNSCGNESVVYIGDYDDVDKMAILARSYTNARRGQRTELRVANFFCVMIPRTVWDDVGELDENFGVGLFEDDDYAMRVRAAGHRVACAEDVFVHHHHSASIGALGTAAYDELFNRNRRYFESKWGVWTPPVFRKQVQDVIAERAGTLPIQMAVGRGVATSQR